MEPIRLRRLIESAGMSQGQFGRAVGKAPRTIREYVGGETAIPETIARIVRVCERDARFLDMLEGADGD